MKDVCSLHFSGASPRPGRYPTMYEESMNTVLIQAFRLGDWEICVLGCVSFCGSAGGGRGWGQRRLPL